jgi:hypothetical protein
MEGVVSAVVVEDPPPKDRVPVTDREMVMAAELADSVVSTAASTAWSGSAGGDADEPPPLQAAAATPRTAIKVAPISERRDRRDGLFPQLFMISPG